MTGQKGVGAVPAPGHPGPCCQCCAQLAATRHELDRTRADMVALTVAMAAVEEELALTRWTLTEAGLRVTDGAS